MKMKVNIMPKKLMSFFIILMLLADICGMVFNIFIVPVSARELNEREKKNVEAAIKLLKDNGYKKTAEKLNRTLKEGKIKSKDLDPKGRSGECTVGGTITIDDNIIDPYSGFDRTIDQVAAHPGATARDKRIREGAYDNLVELTRILVHELTHANQPWTSFTLLGEIFLGGASERAALDVELGFLHTLQARIINLKSVEDLTAEERSKLRKLEGQKHDVRTLLSNQSSVMFGAYSNALANAPAPISFGTNNINAYIHDVTHCRQDPLDFRTYTHYMSIVTLFGLNTENGAIENFFSGGFSDPTMVWSITSAIFDKILQSSDPVSDALNASNLGDFVLKPAFQKWDLRRNEWNTISFTIIPSGGTVEIINGTLHIVSPIVEPSLAAASANDPSITDSPYMYTIKFRDKIVYSHGKIIHTFNDNIHSNITFGYNSTNIFTIDPTTQEVFDSFNLTTNLNQFYNWTLLVDSEFKNINIYRDREFVINLQFNATDNNASSGWVWTAAKEGAELFEDYLYIDSGLIPPNNPPTAVPNGPYFGHEHSTISFDGSSSFDINGTIESFHWSFGDGTFSNETNPTHVYDLPPEIMIISPERTTYHVDSVDLKFAIDTQPLPIVLEVIDNNKEWHLDTTELTLVKDPISWIGYSLDNQPNVTITGNITLTDLTYGLHNITIYATDTSGKTGFAIQYFELSRLVGGVWVPVDKFALLAPYIALASTILVATAATAICVKRVKRRKKKQ